MNDEIEQLIQSAGRRPAVPDDVAARVKANVRDAWKSEVAARRTRRRFLYIAPLAAAAAIAIVFFLRPSKQLPVERVQIATIERTTGQLRAEKSLFAGSEVVTVASARAAIRITDGTSIRVDENTHLRLMDAKHYRLDAGAIYVDAAHSGLSVATPFGIVRDIGTKFEVRVEGDHARVRVREGMIALGEHRARHGEQLIATAHAVVESPAATWGDDWAWLNDVAPPFTVDGKRVNQFLAWVASESGVEVRYDSLATQRKADEVTLRGSFGELRPLAAADAVLPTAGLRAEVRDGVLTVSQQ